MQIYSSLGFRLHRVHGWSALDLAVEILRSDVRQQLVTIFCQNWRKCNLVCLVPNCTFDDERELSLVGNFHALLFQETFLDNLEVGSRDVRSQQADVAEV